MNARVPICKLDREKTPEQLCASDRAFLRQLKVANRSQLRAMLQFFADVVPDGSRWNTEHAWKRAIVERKLGINRAEFPWMKRTPLGACR